MSRSVISSSGSLDDSVRVPVDSFKRGILDRFGRMPANRAFYMANVGLDGDPMFHDFMNLVSEGYGSTDTVYHEACCERRDLKN